MTTENTAAPAQASTTTTANAQPSNAAPSTPSQASQSAPAAPATRSLIDPKAAPAPADQQQADPQQQQRLFANKYKTEDDLKKGVLEARKRQGHAVPENYDWKDAKAEDIEKEYLSRQSNMSQTVPEKYEFDPLLKENNLTWIDAKEQDQTNAEFRALDLKPYQVAGILKMYGGRLNTMATFVGAPPDQAKELETLRQKWGGEFDSKMAAVANVKRKLGDGVFQNPLDFTADGMEMLYMYSTLFKGPETIKNNAAGSSAIDVDARRQEIINDPMYRNPTSPIGEKLRREYMELTKRKTGEA